MVPTLPSFRLGNVSPTGAINDIQPYEFYRIAPPSVIQVSVGLGLQEYTRANTEEALQRWWACLDRLMARQVQVVVQSGIPIAAVMGRPYTLDLLRQTEQRTGVPCQSNLESVILAMKHLGVERLAIGSQWEEDLNDAMIAYLAEAGIETVGLSAKGFNAEQCNAMTYQEGLDYCLETGRVALRAAPDAQGLLLPGGAWMSLHAIPTLEAEFGQPVFINLTAMLWQALRQGGCWQPIQGWGQLMASA